MRPDLIAKLRPYQVEPASRLLQALRAGGVGFDLSDTGTGKTYVAAAIAAELQVPTLVIGPKVSESAWRRAAAHFGDSFSFLGWELLRTGNTPFGKWENGPMPDRESRIVLKCPNCQRKLKLDFIPPCSAHWAGLHCFETKTEPYDRGKFVFNPAISLLIFDEIHRASSDSLNGDMVIAAARQKIPTLGLTATLAHSPLHLQATGFLAGLHKLADFGTFCARRGCRRVPMRGIQWMAPKEQQNAIMAAIGNSIVPAKGIRIRTADIPDFPGRSILPELYDLPKGDTEELNALYSLLETPLADLEARAALDVDPEHPLTKRLRARQRIELLKVGVAEELGRDYRAEGKSVVWFVNYRQTIDELLRRFPEALVIDGEVTGKSRDAVIEQFQINTCRELIVNNKAGGIALSLHDLTGDAERVGIVFPDDSAVTMQQLFGRLARAGGKSEAAYRVIFASRSVEVKMRRELELKYCNLESLNGKN